MRAGSSDSSWGTPQTGHPAGTAISVSAQRAQNGESLELTAKRTLPFFDRCIAGDLRLGKNVLVVAHGNSNRSIVMQLDRLTGEQVIALELATGAPLVYEMAQDGTTVQSKRILG